MKQLLMFLIGIVLALVACSPKVKMITHIYSSNVYDDQLNLTGDTVDIYINEFDSLIVLNGEIFKMYGVQPRRKELYVIPYKTHFYLVYTTEMVYKVDYFDDGIDRTYLVNHEEKQILPAKAQTR